MVNQKLNSTKEDTSVISIDKDIKYRCRAPVFFYAQKNEKLYTRCMNFGNLFIYLSDFRYQIHLIFQNFDDKLISSKLVQNPECEFLVKLLCLNCEQSKV